MCVFSPRVLSHKIDVQGVEVAGGVPCGRGRLEFPWGDVYVGEVQGGRPEVATHEDACLPDLSSIFLIYMLLVCICAYMCESIDYAVWGTKICREWEN